MEALIPLIIEYAVKYGIPAAVSLVEAIKKPNMTWDDIQAAFKIAETPYGLTANLGAAPLTDLGVVIAPTAPVPTEGLPAEFVAHPELVITQVFSGGSTICNASGNCWRIQDTSKILKTPATGGEVWQVGSLRFFVTATALKV